MLDSGTICVRRDFKLIMNLILKAMVATVFALVVTAQTAVAQPADPVVTGTLTKTSAQPGEVIDGTLKVVFAEGLHAYQNPQEDETIIPIKLTTTTGELVEISYPKGEKKVLGGLTQALYVHGGTIEIPFKLRMPETAGEQEVKIVFSYQQCDEVSCYRPGKVETPFKVNLTGEVIAKTATPTEPTTPTPVPVANTQADGGRDNWLKENFEKGNWLALIPALLGIGLLINLTPCVYPLIPITLAFFASQAKEGEETSLVKKGLLGLAYMVGIAVSYGIVGGIAASSGGVFGALFANPLFNIAMGILFIGLSLSMFDVYQIGIPAGLSKHLKGRSGPLGALIMGSLVGVGAAPCAGPIIIALVAAVSETKSPFIGIMTFVIVGLGLGLPYFALSFVSNSRAVLPKAGGWMKTVKAIMGLAVIYFGVEYLVRGLSPYTGPVNLDLVKAIFFAGAALTILIYDGSTTDVRTWRVKSTGILLAGVMAGMSFSSYQFTQLGGRPEMEFEKFTAESWEAAKKSGKPIFVDVGADWCAECKVIEANVLNKEESIAASKDIIRLKIDHSTGTDPAYVDYTSKLFNIKGLPHLMFFPSGGENPKVEYHLDSPEDFIKEVQAIGGSN